jgi:phage terminase large subunit-like protein
MDTETEINQLKKEVATLKEQLRELRSFFTIETLDEPSQRKIMHLRCWGVTLVNPTDPGQTQGMICGSEDGPFVTLSGADDRARVMIGVEKNQGHIRVYQDELKQIVDIGLDASGKAQVGVLHEGKPRAVLKATPEIGIVSAVHDDGTVRAVMSSHFDHGEFMVVGGDMKAAVKLSADGMDGGGYLTVNHANGKAALILSSTRVGGGVISCDSRGSELAVWPGKKSQEDGEKE